MINPLPKNGFPIRLIVTIVLIVIGLVLVFFYLLGPAQFTQATYRSP